MVIKILFSDAASMYDSLNAGSDAVMDDEPERILYQSGDKTQSQVQIGPAKNCLCCRKK